MEFNTINKIIIDRLPLEIDIGFSFKIAHLTFVSKYFGKVILRFKRSFCTFVMYLVEKNV